jgi:hypothetical protein
MSKIINCSITSMKYCPKVGSKELDVIETVVITQNVMKTVGILIKLAKEW